MPDSPQDDPVNIALMGMTGTGKSSFIKLLSDDDRFCVGHETDSETSDVQAAHYEDQASKRSIMMMDTPGFDDSRSGATDIQVLEKISIYLGSCESHHGARAKLNGILFMHRITDPRVGGLSRNIIKMFKALCGDDSLRNVRIVTTNWDRVTCQEGTKREDDLRQGPFSALIDAGAQMSRHDNTVESAEKIISELIPLHEVTTQLQNQITSGIPLGKTDAGRVANADLEELEKKHSEERAGLERELAAVRAHLGELEKERSEERAELERELAAVRAHNAGLEEQERKRSEELAKTEAVLVAVLAQQQKLAEEMERAREDRETLSKNFEELRKAEEERRKPPKVNFLKRLFGVKH